MFRILRSLVGKSRDGALDRLLEVDVHYLSTHYRMLVAAAAARHLGGELITDGTIRTDPNSEVVVPSDYAYFLLGTRFALLNHAGVQDVREMSTGGCMILHQVLDQPPEAVVGLFGALMEAMPPSLDDQPDGDPEREPTYSEAAIAAMSPEDARRARLLDLGRTLGGRIFETATNGAAMPEPSHQEVETVAALLDLRVEERRG